MTQEAAPVETPADEFPQAKIVSPKARTKTVKLDWPVEFDGVTYDEVTIRRLTGREVELFLEDIANRKEGEPRPQPPLLDCPYPVYEAMDDDDRLRVEGEMWPFLPRRLRPAAESISDESENTPE